MRFASTLAAGLLLGGLGLAATAASAAPAMPQPGLIAGDTVEHVRMNSRRGSMVRQQRRMQVKRYGSPNARNPSRPGYQQQLGNVSGGPRR